MGQQYRTTVTQEIRLQGWGGGASNVLQSKKINPSLASRIKFVARSKS